MCRHGFGRAGRWRCMRAKRRPRGNRWAAKDCGAGVCQGSRQPVERVFVPGWALEQIQLQARREPVRLRVRSEGPSEGYSSGKRDRGYLAPLGLATPIRLEARRQSKANFKPPELSEYECV